MKIFSELQVLKNPEIYEINRLPAHSDHKFYSSLQNAKNLSRDDLCICLNGQWAFEYAETIKDATPDFFDTDISKLNFSSITIPSNIEMKGFGKPHYVNTMYPWDGVENIRPGELTEFNPVGSYIKQITIDKNDDFSKCILSFEGVQSAFALWVNGKFIGYSEGSFTTAEFDVTDNLNHGNNTIAVRVYKYCSGSWLEDQDYWRLTGIFRDVNLYMLPKSHINDIKVTQKFSCNYTKADICVNYDIVGNKDVTIKGILTDKNGNEIFCETKDNALKFCVENPKLWSAQTPNLYCLQLIATDNNSGDVIEVTSQKIGLRELKMIDKIYTINGKRIVFNGVNRHEFSHINGRALTKEELLWDIKCIKKNNINAVRTSHYPNNTMFYEMCDEYGIYVIDETNLESHGSWQKMGKIEPSWVIPDDKKEWRESCLSRAKSMYERDKNHSCIVMWSCGNESYGGKTIFEMSQYFRENDSSRVVHYEGVFNDRRFNDTSDFESRMYAKPCEIEEYLNSNPQKPFMLCEYTHAMGNSNGGMSKYTELLDKYPMYQGGFIWDFIDQAILSKTEKGKEYLAFGGDFGDRPTDYNFCVNGIVFADRKVSPKMAEVKALYAPFYIYPDSKGVTIQNRTLFDDLCNYDILYSVEYNGYVEQKGKLEFSLASEEKKHFELPFISSDKKGIYTYNVSIVLKEDTKWAKSGYEVAFGQFSEEKAKSAINPSEKIEIIDGDVNIGVYGKDFRVMFSKNLGTIVSIKHVQELLDNFPMPTFWRATTDNDRGNGFNIKNSQWKIASMYAHCIGYELSGNENKAEITFKYSLNMALEALCTIKYTVTGDGKISVCENYYGVEGLPIMPLFGMEFSMPQKYKKVDWFALGKEENYCDRNSGVKLMRFTTNPQEDVTQYVIPQECGNRTGVREVSITDENGKGLKFCSDSGMEASVLPYTVHELENAFHHYDLPDSNHTIIRVAKCQCGVGGDDSWGAPVHDEYLINSNENIEFKYTINVI